jgi:hypothetical protein
VACVSECRGSVCCASQLSAYRGFGSCGCCSSINKFKCVLTHQILTHQHPHISVRPSYPQPVAWLRPPGRYVAPAQAPREGKSHELLGVFLHSKYAPLKLIDRWPTAAGTEPPVCTQLGSTTDWTTTLRHTGHLTTLHDESIPLLYFNWFLIDFNWYFTWIYIATFVSLRSLTYALRLPAYILPQYYSMLSHSPFYFSTTLGTCFYHTCFTIF